MAETQNNENACVVCFKNVLYYSIGECDHPVCFECSTRMRVLCLQNECPICRQDLARVVFTDSIQSYKELRSKVFPDRLFERQFKIGFCSEAIKNAYERLLENCCKVCDNLPPFRTFTMLSDHMRKVHERYFCDLCVKHLKIFTIERKCYTRQELAHHRRKGDLDDTSHRGHPLCEFCEERFMDADELYRHLRKEHLYCHLCDADGRNLYYASHSALAHHFRTDHYLCEEGECAEQHLTAVFRSDIDLQAHKATAHGRGMTRGAARQARTLALQFNITPHPGMQRGARERAEVQSSEVESGSVFEGAGGTGGAGGGGGGGVAAPSIDTRSDAQFPRLSAAPTPANLVLAPSGRSYRGSDRLVRDDRNFPALDGSGGNRAAPRASAPATPTPATVAATIVRNTKPSVSIQLHSQPASASNFRLTQTSGNRISIPQQKKQSLIDDDFPSLGGNIPRDDHPNLGASTVQPPKVAMVNSQEMQAIKNSQAQSHQKKPQLSSEAFPALSSTSAPAAPPQWITVSKSKEKPKPAKPDPPPQPRAPAFNAVADFPTLPVNNNKLKMKKTVQSPPQPPPQQAAPLNETKSNKKEKKKQNSKKENLIETTTREIPHVNGLDKRYARDPSFTEVNVNNNQNVERGDKKIKTIETSSTVTVNSEKNRNTGNGDFALAARDYPPLNPRGDPVPAPPPGSWNDANHAPKKVPNGSVPPGFKPRPPCDGMTFTNSAGQTFSAPPHKYIPPPEFERRNRELVQQFSEALGGAHVLEEFKVASRAFRDGIIGAEEFLAHCRAALGARLSPVLPELVALLPDIRKQQELALGRDLPLHVCAVCGQLLAPADRPPHDAAHWPPLAPR